MQKPGWKHYLTVGLWFGGFQALMPTLGYLLGTTFERYITSVDHWVAFVLLCLIGGNMLKRAFPRSNRRRAPPSVSSPCCLWPWPPSVDALAVGITFACCRMCIFSVP